jgi:hypothetical protein
MPVRVNEFVIQAQFDEEESSSQPSNSSSISEEDLLMLKSEIMDECMNKIEALLQKREGR